MPTPREKISSYLALATGVAFWLGVLFLLGQVFVFLYTGEWVPLPLLLALHNMGIEWTAWAGVYKILSWFSLPGGLFLLAGLFLYVGSLVSDS